MLRWLGVAQIPDGDFAAYNNILSEITNAKKVKRLEADDLFGKGPLPGLAIPDLSNPTGDESKVVVDHFSLVISRQVPGHREFDPRIASVKGVGVALEETAPEVL